MNPLLCFCAGEGTAEGKRIVGQGEVDDPAARPRSTAILRSIQRGNETLRVGEGQARQEANKRKKPFHNGFELLVDCRLI